MRTKTSQTGGDDEDELQQKHDANDTAITDLILSMKGPPFGIVEGAKNEDFPNRSAALAWATSERKHGPTKIQLKGLFQNCKTMQEATEDPDLWYLRMDHINTRLKSMNAGVSEDNYVAHLINELPKVYSEMRTDFEGRKVEELTEV